MTRDPIPTWYFVLVAVRFGHRWLLVHEHKHGQLWYIPAGRVEAGESLVTAAKRETMEEAGIPIEIDGIVRIEHSPRPDGTSRCRVIFLAHPADDTQPKHVPDTESLEAGWYTLAEIRPMPLRGTEVIDLFHYLEGHPNVAPINMLSEEGAPYP